MKSIQITYFLDLAKTLNFTETANRFFISQPAVSKQIIALEGELGVKLFDRNKKSVTLTEAGKLYYDHFNRAEEEFKITQKRVENLKRREKTTLNISFLMAWNLSPIFPKLIKYYQAHHPEIKLVFENHTFNNLDERLQRGEIDIAITILDKSRIKKNYQTKHITTINSLLFFANDHPLRQKDHLNIQDFKNDNFIIYTDQTELYSRNLMKSIIQPYGFIPNTIVVSSVEAMVMSVEAGLGVAFFDEWIRYRANPHLTYIRTEMTRKIAAVWLKNSQSKLIEDFAAAFTQIITDHQDEINAI